MTQGEELWQFEEQFWLGGAEFYERMLAPEALMVLPFPAGILDRLNTITSIQAGTRWQHVAFHSKRLIRPNPDTAVLVYAVAAGREAPSTPYHAQCSSTYVCAGGQWQLVLHHQTPAQPDNDGRA